MAEVIWVDSKLTNKFALHKFLENGGTIRFNNLGVIGISHNPATPNSPMVELKLGFIPAGEKFKGHVNPTATKVKYKKEDKKKSSFEIEEGEVEEI
jgi:hypothetical protein